MGNALPHQGHPGMPLGTVHQQPVADAQASDILDVRPQTLLVATATGNIGEGRGLEKLRSQTFVVGHGYQACWYPLQGFTDGRHVQNE